MFTAFNNQILDIVQCTKVYIGNDKSGTIHSCLAGQAYESSELILEIVGIC